jgi:hypothetical protein
MKTKRRLKIGGAFGYQIRGIRWRRIYMISKIEAPQKWKRIYKISNKRRLKIGGASIRYQNKEAPQIRRRIYKISKQRRLKNMRRI